MDLADFDPLNPSSSIIGAQWLKSESQGKLSMELDFVAIRYAKYYWDMFHRYRLQQSHNPTDVNIHKIFPEIANPPTLEVLATDRYARLRKEVIGRSIRPQVLKFLNNDMHLYEIIPTAKSWHLRQPTSIVTDIYVTLLLQNKGDAATTINTPILTIDYKGKTYGPIHGELDNIPLEPGASTPKQFQFHFAGHPRHKCSHRASSRPS